MNVPQGSVAGPILSLIFISDFTGQLTVHELGEVARCSLQAIELLELPLATATTVPTKLVHPETA